MSRSRHIKATVQYDGTAYAGFQRQKGLATIQGELESALSFIAGHPLRVVGAGRTDAGVHAVGQVVCFSLEGNIPTERIPEAANARLPADIALWDAVEVPTGFHPQYEAVSKLYSYTVWRDRRRSPFYSKYSYHFWEDLSMDPLVEAANVLVGEHDFRAFRAMGSSVKGSVRTLNRLDVNEEGPFLRFYLEADGFLYNMVRIIVGTLLETGRGRLTPGDVRHALETGERGMAGPTVPASGLCLEQVRYS
ncbi:MAG: tRNA pseudouridine(38-40) synthase TruA [Bacillota bacterium]